MTMAIPVKHRWIFYLIMLACTLVAVKWAGGQDRAEVAVAEPLPRADTATVPASRDSSATEAVPELQLDKLSRRARPTSASDPFEARSWEELARAEARRSAPPPPPPPPQAPPLPFVYLGKLIEEGGRVTVFLTKQDRNYIVRTGDTIDGVYAVEAAEEERVVFTYLPLGISQTLAFAAPTGPGGNLPAPAALPAAASAAAKRDDDEEDN